MPPALVIVDENDILRDEGEQCARKLIQAGVEVTPIGVLATHHDYALLNALADTPAMKVTFGETLGSTRLQAPSGGASGRLILFRYGAHQGDACLGPGGLTVGARRYNEGRALPTGT